jgi:acyl CoA:acetate/3-ketoacid CoA transferase alpha subunit
MRVRIVELGRGRLMVAGMLGDVISVPLSVVRGAWADGEDLVVDHTQQGQLRFPLRAGSARLREWLARSVDMASERARQAPRGSVPGALVRMVRGPDARAAGPVCITGDAE